MTANQPDAVGSDTISTCT